jgi:NADH-quinone oxidoreductase subunit E
MNVDSGAEINEKQLKKILVEHGSDVKNLIPILQSIQEMYGYLPSAAITAVADELSISEDVIFGVATFYTHFKFTRPGKHTIRACMGTACFVKEAENLMELIRERLGIEAGETTPDGNITFERVACLGCCALAPTIVVDEEVYGKMTTQKLATVLDEMIADSETGSGDPGTDDDHREVHT